MKLLNAALSGFGGFLAVTLFRPWMASLDYRIAYYDPHVDPVFPECRGRKIFVFWHEHILFPVFHRSHSSIAILLSRHRDADVLSHVAYQLGFRVVRGSTQRGGAAALRELLRESGRLHLAITPDGPRGPRRRMAPGPIYMASRLGLPVVAAGFGCDRPWRITSTWDHFAIPRPFSRARAVFSPEILVPKDLDREGLEHFRRRIEALLNRLCDEADAWAASGNGRKGEERFRFAADYRGRRRLDCPHPGAGLSPHPVTSVAGKPHAS
jgi:lysophospholipid acyltransferase (LPLAT)-like uncharacterized protein